MEFTNKYRLVHKAADLTDILKDTNKVHPKVILSLHKAILRHHKVTIKALPSKILLLVDKILNLPHPLINNK
jgi:hypothetical protein